MKLSELAVENVGGIPNGAYSFTNTSASLKLKALA